ncbi:MAG TPA: hypothetical protein VF192_11265 [Longimicrobiales bacterium]
MAREIRVARGVGRPGVTGDGQARREVQPTTIEEARREIESTRGRISGTLDAIELRLQEKREDLRNRLDVLRPVRRRIRSSVWPSLGIAFGTGVVLGMLRRGGGREARRGAQRHELSAGEREQLRRWRAERRKRLEQRARATRRRGRSMFAQLRSALSRAVIDGLTDRARRMRG